MPTTVCGDSVVVVDMVDVIGAMDATNAFLE